jgi:polysaccharide deacetylase 2 family uncharacterized protein YibQ
VDDFSAPLGRDRPPRRWGGIPRLLPRAALVVLSGFLVLVVSWAMLADDPFGGEPMAVAPAKLADRAAESDAAPSAPAGQATAEHPRRYDGPSGIAPPETAPAAAPAAPAAPSGKTITIIDGTSGKRQEIVLPGAGEARDDKPDKPMQRRDGRQGAAERPDAKAGDPRLTETSRHGPLPRPGPDGLRPAEAYANPVKPSRRDTPRVALVVGGLGVSATATADAIASLPAAVTLAFTPYGGGLDSFAARARAAGHELLLQVPMEPYDYPDNDPGPQTLLTSLEAEQNVDRLQWAMSRFQGYVGIANFMGARFTASEPALAPVLAEAGKRGLIYFDDGSSPRSLGRQLAGAGPFARADLTIDTVATAGEIERALGRLELIARERGLAVGMASALPVSIERIVKWAKSAEARGLQLVPISAAAKQPADERRRTTENRTTDDRGRRTDAR